MDAEARPIITSRWTPAFVLWSLLAPIYHIPMFSILIFAKPFDRLVKALGRFARATPLQRWAQAVLGPPLRALGMRFAKDESNLHVMPYLCLPLLWLPVAAWFVYEPTIWKAVLYWVLLMGPELKFYSGCTGMMHRSAHTPGCYLKAPFDRFQTLYLEYFLGFFHGTPPGSFPVSHVRMHHACDNNDEDPSTTLRFNRSSVWDYFRYSMGPAFLYVGGISPVIYFYKKKRTRSFREMLSGVALFYGLMLIMFFVDWRMAITFQLMPLLLNVTGFSIANWVQHGFADPAAPFDVDTNTTTMLVPQLFLNEHHHYIHHAKPAALWSRDAENFEAARERIAHKDPIVFEGIHYPDIWRLMLRGRFEELGKYFVILNKNRRPEEVGALLRERAQRVLV